MVHRKAYILTLLLFLSGIIFGQNHFQLAHPNPDYIKFLNEYNNGETKMAAPPPYNPDFSQYFKAKQGKAPVDFPVAFDLRTAGPGETSLLTPVKHQLSCGACWAFATMSSIESVWKMTGLGDFDLSENNLKNCHGFDLDPCQWGHHFMSTAYLVRGSGPDYESDDPYDPLNPDCQYGIQPVAYIPESDYLPEDPDAFKDAIMNIGPVYNTFRSVSANYQWINGHLTYCYQGSLSTTHAIAIVGWNDTLTTGCGHGAWLVKDEYGTGWGEGGYYYIAYQDTLVLKYNAIWPVREDYDSTLKIYQIDTIGGWPFAGYGDSIAYGLVKFTAEGNQFLTHLGTYTVSYDSHLSAEIFSGFDGATLSGLLMSVPEQTIEFPGYHRLELPEPLRIDDGEDFYIRIRYNSPGTTTPIAFEGVEEGYTNPFIESGKCWTRAENGYWEAIGTGNAFEYDLCIKAYAHDVTKIDIRTLLEGPFNGTVMATVLSYSPDFPLNQPYDQSPWNYDGNENLTVIPPEVVDWVLIDLRETTGSAETATPDKIIARQAALIKSDGSVVGMDGSSMPVFTVSVKENLYCVIYHRNHLAVMSAIPLQKVDGIFQYDFTLDAGKAYGGSLAQKELTTGIYGMIGGDANTDGVIDAADKSGSWEMQSGRGGYFQSDFNLDLKVDNVDKNDFWVPNLGFNSQIPE